MKRYTKEQLLFYLVKLSKKLNRTPTIKDINLNKKTPSSSTYVNRFGSWNKSLKKVNLKINLRKKYNEDELIQNLQTLSKQLGRIPKTSDLTNKKWLASSSTYRAYFKSWKNALGKADLLKESFKDLKHFVKK